MEMHQYQMTCETLLQLHLDHPQTQTQRMDYSLLALIFGPEVLGELYPWKKEISIKINDISQTISTSDPCHLYFLYHTMEWPYLYWFRLCILDIFAYLVSSLATRIKHFTSEVSEKTNIVVPDEDMANRTSDHTLTQLHLWQHPNICCTENIIGWCNKL